MDFQKLVRFEEGGKVVFGELQGGGKDGSLEVLKLNGNPKEGLSNSTSSVTKTEKVRARAKMRGATELTEGL